MEGSGDALVPTNQTLVTQGPCEGVEISVTAHPPSSLSRTTTTGSKKGGANTSFVPQLRLRTSASRKWVWPSIRKTRTVGNSIQRSLDASPDRTTLLVPAGQYYESLNLTKPVTLVADGTGRVVLFGRISISSHDVTVDGISVYPTDPFTSALEIASSSDVFVQNCRIVQDQLQQFALRARNSSAIHVSESSRVHFTNLIVSGHGGCGLSMERCRHCVIQTSVFRACRNAVGVAGSDHLRLIGSYFRDNAAVMLLPPEGPGKGLVMRGNLFVDNTHFAISSSDGSVVTLHAAAGRSTAGGSGGSYLAHTSGHRGPGSPAQNVVVMGSCSGDDSNRAGDDSNRAADPVMCVHMEGMNVIAS